MKGIGRSPDVATVLITQRAGDRSPTSAEVKTSHVCASCAAWSSSELAAADICWTSAAFCWWCHPSLPRSLRLMPRACSSDAVTISPIIGAHQVHRLRHLLHGFTGICTSCTPLPTRWPDSSISAAISFTHWRCAVPDYALPTPPRQTASLFPGARASRR